nr:hypothetical protein TorRG33x02_059440 [Ipomoea batatas]
MYLPFINSRGGTALPPRTRHSSSLYSVCIDTSLSKNKTPKFSRRNRTLWQSSNVFRTPLSPVVYRITDSEPPGGHFSGNFKRGLGFSSVFRSFEGGSWLSSSSSLIICSIVSSIMAILSAS